MRMMLTVHTDTEAGTQAIENGTGAQAAGRPATSGGGHHVRRHAGVRHQSPRRVRLTRPARPVRMRAEVRARSAGNHSLLSV